MRKTIAIIIIIVLVVARTAAAGEQPKLIIFVSVDQMRADYLERFRNDFTGGFKRILDEGAIFKNADINSAPSETGPGHASLSTGTYPWKSGILSNEWTDRTTRRNVYCVEDTFAKQLGDKGGGFSPRALEVTAIGDWLMQASPDSKVIAVSEKDRAAILMGGRHPNYAFWYDRKSGHMVTSDYYVRIIPDWVKTFNAQDWIQHNVPDAWTKLRPEDYYAKLGPDELKGEMVWNGSTAFPHAFNAGKKKDQILTSPYTDMMVLDFARAALGSEQLGQRSSVDLLCISLSSTDYIGHAYGPNSHEMADQILRLDLALGLFLSNVEHTVGRGKVLLALSADHAVMPLPEYTTSIEHKFARRIIARKQIIPEVDTLDRSLQKEFGTTEHVIQSNSFLNYSAAAKAGIDSLELERKVRNGLLKIDGIVEVFSRRELLNPTTSDRPYLGYFRRGYFPPRGKDIVVRFCENCLLTNSEFGTGHGSPYPYDTHVPIVFWGVSVKTESVGRSVHSVDIAPTLATLLGLKYPATVDGKPLPEVIQ